MTFKLLGAFFLSFIVVPFHISAQVISVWRPSSHHAAEVSVTTAKGVVLLAAHSHTNAYPSFTWADINI